MEFKPTLRNPVSDQSEKFQKNFDSGVPEVTPTTELNEVDGLLTEKEQSLKKKIWSLAKMESLVFSDPKLSAKYEEMAENGEEKYGYHYNETIQNMIFNDYVLNSPKYLQKYKMAIPKEKKRRDKSGINQLKKAGEKKMDATGTKLSKPETVDEEIHDELTKVVFLIHPNHPEVYAFFPEENHDVAGRYKMGYAHVGQHTAIDPNYATDSKLATPEEYQELKTELEGQGYELEVYNEMANESTSAGSAAGSSTYVGYAGPAAFSSKGDLSGDFKGKKKLTDPKAKPISTGFSLKETNYLTDPSGFETYVEMLNEEAKSKSQQQLMGMAYAVKTGKFDGEPSAEILKLADNMSEKDLEDFASTKHKGLPDHVEENNIENMENMQHNNYNPDIFDDRVRLMADLEDNVISTEEKKEFLRQQSSPGMENAYDNAGDNVLNSMYFKYWATMNRMEEDTQTMIQGDGMSMSNKSQATGDMSSEVPMGAQDSGGLNESITLEKQNQVATNGKTYTIYVVKSDENPMELKQKLLPLGFKMNPNKGFFMFEPNMTQEVMNAIEAMNNPEMQMPMAMHEEEEFIPHGSYTVSNSGGYEIMLNDAGDAARVRDAFGSDNPKTSDWLEIEYVPNEDDVNGEFEPVIDPNGYNISLNQVMRMTENSIPTEMNEDMALLQEINNELAAFETHHKKLKLMAEDKKTPSMVQGDRLRSENPKNFKKDIQHSGTKDIIDVEKELEWKDQQTDVPSDPQKLGKDIEKQAIKVGDMKGDEALKNVGDSANNDGDEIPKRNLTTKEQDEVDLYRNGQHSLNYDNEPGDKFVDRMKADQGEFFDMGEKQKEFRANAPMYDKDPQPVEQTEVEKVEFDKNVKQKGDKVAWNERMGIGSNIKLGESMITGRYKDALNKSRLIEFRLNEVQEVETIDEDITPLSFVGLGNTYMSKTVDKKVVVNEGVVETINRDKFYTDGKQVFVVQTPAQSLNESEVKKEKPVISEQEKKMKHLLGYKPQDFVNTKNIRL